MSAAELRQAAETLRERAASVLRPYAMQERVDEALADWLDCYAAVIEREHPIAFAAEASMVARLINGVQS